MTTPLLTPGSADALLFDLGRVVINVDFNRTLAFFTSYTAQLDPDDYFGQSILAGFKIAF